MSINYTSTIEKTSAIISAINFDELPISDYNKQYIRILKPAINFYLRIYSYCIDKGLQGLKKSYSDITLVDFGGGSGFLSIFAKKLGIGKVIYVDLNPLSVETIELLKAKTGVGPDIILHGSSDTLAKWCLENNISPDLLIATDLIEHVYDLEVFFDELTNIGNSMRMIFTTASTPYNPYVKRRLHRMMRGCESGSLLTPNYYTRRLTYIRKHFVGLSEQEAVDWALKTRGLIYSDIENAIEKNLEPIPLGAYNTCDPETGNWTERILPIKEYRRILSQHSYQVSIYKGFYNNQRIQIWKSVVVKFINWLIRISGKAGFFLSPFIVFVCDKKKE